MRKSILSERQVGFERLENRTVLNGTVTATGAGNALVLTGDASNNAIVVHQIGTNCDGSGAIIQVAGVGTKINNLDTTKTGYVFTFGSGSGNGITSVEIEMGDGSDVVTLSNTTVSGSITVNMDDPSSGGVGDGNDVLTMANVHSTGETVSVFLGNGNNVAALVNVTASSGFSLDAGDGRNTVVLNSVSAGSGQDFSVGFGSGKFNTVTVVKCSGGEATFEDGGVDGILAGAGDSFESQIVDTFQFRYGDLKNDMS